MPRKSSSKKQNTGNAAVIYARYSSHNQKDASIEQQVEACLKYARELGLTVIDSYADRAVTGKTDKRPQFQKLMKDAAKGRFDYVLAWKSNRMGRNMLQALQNAQRLNECGVQVFYAEEHFEDNAAGRFALRSMMNMNQFYSENMAEDIQRGLLDNARQCKVCGSLPFGYKVSSDHRYEIDEPRAKVVQEIFKSIAAGKTIASIINSLNERGIKNRLGRPFNPNSFTGVLSNERYRGIFLYKDVRIEGGVPRIISDELFFKVQEVLKMKKNPRDSIKRRQNSTYLLTGKLFCGKCKSPMTGAAGTSKTGKLFNYYSCMKKKKEHACDKKNVGRDYIENLIAKYIYEYCLRDDIIEIIADKTIEYNNEKMKNSKVGLFEEELSAVNRNIRNIMKAIEAGIITPTTKERLLELEARKAELKAKIEDEKFGFVQIDKVNLITGLKMFQQGDVTDKKFQSKLFDAFLRAAYLYDGNLKLVFSYPGSENTMDVPLENLVEDDTLTVIAEEAPQSSPEVSKAPPLLTWANTNHQKIRLFMGHGTFVLHIPLCKA